MSRRVYNQCRQLIYDVIGPYPHASVPESNQCRQLIYDVIGPYPQAYVPESNQCRQLIYDVIGPYPQAYVPESNQCRQLMSALTEEDLQFFHDSAKGDVLRYDKNRPQVGHWTSQQALTK